MDIDENDYVIGCWFGFNDDCDVLITCKRNKENPLHWDGEMRIRHYVDEQAFDSKDRKKFWNFRTRQEMSEDEAFRTLDKTAQAVAYDCGFKEMRFVEIKGGAQKFGFRLAQEDFANIKTVNLDDQEKQNANS